jgi:hypothetical protein
MALASVTIKCSVATAAAAATTALLDLAKTIQTTAGVADAAGTTARINLTLATDAGQAIAAGIAFSLSDGKLPKGIKQVYCNTKDQEVVYVVSLDAAISVRNKESRVEAYSEASCVYAKYRASNSVTVSNRWFVPAKHKRSVSAPTRNRSRSWLLSRT